MRDGRRTSKSIANADMIQGHGTESQYRRESGDVRQADAHERLSDRRKTVGILSAARTANGR